MEVLLHPAYFPSCLSMACLAQGPVVWEAWDNYQKQTYRNRCYICNDRGRQPLNIPIRHAGGSHGRQLFREVQIDNGYNWQRQHWRSLDTAYRAAPFFEYYEADLQPLFQRRFDRLMDLDLATIETLCNLLGLVYPEARTGHYDPRPESLHDGRFLVSAKAGPAAPMPRYPQVFEVRHGFVADLSALDLLFNEGRAAADYLRHLKLPWDA